MALDEGKLNEFMGRAVGDMGSAFSAALVAIGDKLGLYKALAREAGTPAELARRTGTAERYVREWLAKPGRGWVRAVRREQRPVLDDGRAGLRPRR